MIGWLGIVLTAIFGLITVIQLIRQLFRRRLQQSRQESEYHRQESEYERLLALKKNMMQLRAQYTEAVAFGGVIESKPQQQFMKDLGHHVRSIEHSVDAMLKVWPATKEQKDERDELFAICAGVREPEKKFPQPPN